MDLVPCDLIALVHGKVVRCRLIVHSFDCDFRPTQLAGSSLSSLNPINSSRDAAGRFERLPLLLLLLRVPSRTNQLSRAAVCARLRQAAAGLSSRDDSALCRARAQRLVASYKFVNKRKARGSVGGGWPARTRAAIKLKSFRSAPVGPEEGTCRCASVKLRVQVTSRQG